jgi:1-deoxy-D-xylulose-5-phosphate reductoisomerase
VLGSTGSIGTQTLEAIENLNADGFAFEVVALVAGRNRAKLAEQAKRWKPKRVAAVVDEGPAVLEQVARWDQVDAVVHAVVGAAGLPAAFAAAGAGKRLCLANKESLVVGGRLLTELARQRGCEIIAVDSEHTAIFQAIACGRRVDVERIVLTASGGPFRDAKAWPVNRLAKATVAEALNHPTWQMGGKITIDSATLFNKGFELIEAVRLYDVPQERVGVCVHPQSIVHSMVEFRDGSTIAHLSPSDMRLPIAYALTHPKRGRSGSATWDWSTPTTLEFEPPDEARFPSLALARQAAEDASGVLATVLNAANEVAVEAFLKEQLSFGGISEVVAAAMQDAPQASPADLEDLLAIDAEARTATERHVH